MEDLKTLRKKAGLTQEQLAVKAGLARYTVKRIEDGMLDCASVGTLRKICKALGCEPSVFFAKDV